MKKYVRDVREKFRTTMAELNLPTEHRLVVEDFLLAYDQLRDAAGDNEIEELIPKMAQVITCVCGSTFAACIEPNCYTEREWCNDVVKYANQGCTISTIPANMFKFERCRCADAVKDIKKRQLLLF